MKVVKYLFTLVLINEIYCIGPAPRRRTNEDGDSGLENQENTLTGQLEKWNNLFLTTLEPKLTSTASTLASLEAKIDNLQERAHVWDTFQIHVSAWNDQLSSLDRKINIISKGQENILTSDLKTDLLSPLEKKLDIIIKKLDDIEDSVSNIDKNIQIKQEIKNHDNLFGEFTSRGILSTIKLVEKKLDRLLISNQHVLLKTKNNEDKPTLNIKCNTPKIIEEQLNDISSKVDVLFDTFRGKENLENDYENEEYNIQQDSSGDISNENKINNSLNVNIFKKIIRRNTRSCKDSNEVLEEIVHRNKMIENMTLFILDKQETSFQKVNKEIEDLKNTSGINKNVFEEWKNCTNLYQNQNAMLKTFFSEQRIYFDRRLKELFTEEQSNVTIADKYFQTTTSKVFTNSESTPSLNELTTKRIETSRNEPESTDSSKERAEDGPISSCEDLGSEHASGVYTFENITSGRWDEHFYNKKFCEIRSDGLWTVIQRRGNYSIQENFNVSWYYYKYGFGDLNKEFWIGNDYLHRLSRKQNLVLRIELEDFEGNSVWAEYDGFKVLAEEDNYKLVVVGYHGNASDSFSTHSGSMFSTYDRKNDEAPECCPCAVSFGGGWWFNKCFESNLNGLYYTLPNSNDYFRGIIWEHWLGNYSLKRTQMMVKSKGRVYTVPSISDEENTTAFMSYYEDP